MPLYLLLTVFIICVRSQTAQVTVDWNDVITISKTTTTLQVVVNVECTTTNIYFDYVYPCGSPSMLYIQALLTRESPIHDETFKSLADLNADFVRFVPWFRKSVHSLSIHFSGDVHIYHVQRMLSLEWLNCILHLVLLFVLI